MPQRLARLMEKRRYPKKSEHLSISGPACVIKEWFRAWGLVFRAECLGTDKKSPLLTCAAASSWPLLTRLAGKHMGLRL